MSKKTISTSELDTLYEQLKKEHAKYLAKYQVKLPKLKSGGIYTKNAVVLLVLYKYIAMKVTKKELTEMLSALYNETISDVQQARHLGKQDGWYILSGQRGQEAPTGLDIALNSGDYCLVGVEEPYPTRLTRAQHHRSGSSSIDIGDLKKQYHQRCATCGSKEGQPNLSDPSVSTKLQLGHMDPTKGLVAGNVIPQCEQCNRAYRDWFKFDATGRVVDINIESDRWNRVYRRI